MVQIKPPMVLVDQEEWDKTVKKAKSHSPDEPDDGDIVVEAKKIGFHLHKWNDVVPRKKVFTQYPSGETKHTGYHYVERCYKCGKTRERDQKLYDGGGI